MKTLKQYIDYKQYLNSPHWQNLKNRHLPGSGCSICGNRHRLLLHHEGYDLYHEIINKDLFVLCWDCHEATHFIRIWKLRIKLPVKPFILRKRRHWLTMKHHWKNRAFKAVVLSLLALLFI